MAHLLSGLFGFIGRRPLSLALLLDLNVISGFYFVSQGTLTV